MKRQSGFTLIELLVVIGILGVLAAVGIPAYTQFFGAGKLEAHATEKVTVQAAMDAMMAHKQILTVATQAAPGVRDFTAAPTGNVLYPDYMRTPITLCFYSWNASGLVKQESC